MEGVVNASDEVEDAHEDEEDDDGQVEEVRLQGDVAEVVQDERDGGAQACLRRHSGSENFVTRRYPHSTHQSVEYSHEIVASTFNNSNEADDRVGVRIVFHGERHAVVNLVGSLDFLEAVDDDLDRQELAEFVEQIKRHVVDSVPNE